MNKPQAVPSFIDWVRQAHDRGAQITMACPDSKSPLNWLGKSVGFEEKQALNHIESHFNKGLPLGAKPSSLRLLCIDFDFPRNLDKADWPSSEALLNELAERKIKHFIEPSQTPGRKHIWVFTAADFAKPKFINVTHQGVKYEALWNQKHVIIWNHEEFIYGAFSPLGEHELTNAEFNAIFHIAANQEDGTANQGGGAGEVDGKAVYETGNAYVVQEDLIQALLANCRDQSLIVENGEWIKVENPCDMSDNMTCRLSFNKATGAAMDFKSELRYSPLELAKALGLTIHKRKGRPKNEAPEGQTEVSGKSLKGLREALAHLNLSVRFNIRATQIEYRRGDKDWQTFDRASKSAMREMIADKFCYAGSHSEFRSLRFGRDLFNDTLWAHVHEHRVDPFIEYLESLPKWDGVERLERVLIDLMGAEDDAFSRWGGKYLFLGPIQRGYEPGCQLDEMLVLVGKSRLGKTSIIKFSVPSGEYYTNSLRFSDPVARRIENTLGVTIAEVAEMQGSTKAEATDIIDYVSTTHDKMRLAFREDAERIPRRFVLAGTTNSRDSLPNHPGMARRFVPVEVYAELNIPHYQSCVDLLYAEALHLYKQGERANVPRDMWEDAEDHAEIFRNRDEVEDILLEVLDEDVKYTLHNIRGLDTRLATLNVNQQRLTSSLRMIGWESKRATHHGVRAKYWIKP